MIGKAVNNEHLSQAAGKSQKSKAKVHLRSGKSLFLVLK